MKFSATLFTFPFLFHLLLVVFALFCSINFSSTVVDGTTYIVFLQIYLLFFFGYILLFFFEAVYPRF